MQRSRATWAAFGLVVACSALSVIGAAVGGPWTISDRGGLWSPETLPAPSLPPNAEPPGGQPTPPPMVAGEPPRWLAWALWIIVAIAISVLLVWLWRRVAEWARSRQEAEPVESEATGEVYPDAPVIRAGLTSALDELSVTANPTDAVLRAWVALEGAAGRSGVPRAAADTPTEFTRRVLATTNADRVSVDALLHLYHQARFSWHGLSTADREKARVCLEGLAASWSSFEVPAPDPESRP
jgi:hypothetical protein